MLVYRRKAHSLMNRSLSNIEEYTKEELMNPEEVRDVLRWNYMERLYITKSGWEFLIEYYGYDGLYEIDKSIEYGFYGRSSAAGKDNSLSAYIEWIKESVERYPEVSDSVYKADRPQYIAMDAIRVGKTVEEVEELFGLQHEYVLELDRQVKEEKAKADRERRVSLAERRLSEGNRVEEVAAECGLPLDYVQELDKRCREIKLKSEKNKKMINALLKGEPAEKIAKLYELPLEYVQEFERKTENARRLRKSKGL